MHKALLLAAATVVLSACGGGSDGGAPVSAVTPAPVATQIALTAANYVAVSQETLSSSSFVTTAASLATGAQVSDSEILIRFGQDQLPKLSRWFANAPVQAVGAVQTQTESCPGGGSLSISKSDLNGNLKFDAGDAATLIATNCMFEGQSLDGKLVLSVNSVTGVVNAPPFSLSVNLGFENLAAQSSTGRTVGNGSMVVALTARALNNQSVSISTQSFSLSATYGGVASTKALTNYLTSQSFSPAGSGFTSTTSSSGTLSSSAFELKSITVATPTPFVRSSTQAYPASGQLLIASAASSKVRITAISSTMLRIELDADGNDVYETSTTKLWSEML